MLTGSISESRPPPPGIPNNLVNAVTRLLLSLRIPLLKEVSVQRTSYPAEAIARYACGIYLLHVSSLEFALVYLPALSPPLDLTAFVVIIVPEPVMSFHPIERSVNQLGRS